ncbi:dihydroxyacetone kinase subunit L [Rhizobium sp. P32RR-XVIII]|uniref:dihydroxyacetone kinase subunit L n=1 Tax=Rhizobium sp. P32RR-XVIII TaxID=2726738 RepID=UPI00145757B8|nr:dihydroxyacetone kinase subunit L [Rhizobium sp. P32RR-XVIII]NLS07344.1 dihydroxyacetone kinase subunit L [Rhizobium sp. P32RR-XVIII]
MTGFTSSHVRSTALKASVAMDELKSVLNEADARIGDGDTGSMLARVLKALADRANADKSETVGATCLVLAQTAASSTGSSLGTLLATGLMSVGKATQENKEVDWSALGGLLAEAQQKMAARGGASLGDKTILDGLHAVAIAIAECNDQQSAAEAARRGAHAALDEFRQKPNRMGRARMFANATIGLDDPGMLALAKLIEAIANDSQG